MRLNLVFEANANSVVFIICTLFEFHAILVTKIENIFLDQGIGNIAQNYCNSNSNRGQKIY